MNTVISGQGAITMSTDNPTPSGKPAKPYPEFPLFAHAAGVWAKKIRGKLCYFGPWSDPDGALKRYEEQKEALHAGRKPREDTEGLTVKELCTRFLNAKQAAVHSGCRTQAQAPLPAYRRVRVSTRMLPK
jgi:hypothetical protein